jgi:hypothetical protein
MMENGKTEHIGGFIDGMELRDPINIYEDLLKKPPDGSFELLFQVGLSEKWNTPNSYSWSLLPHDPDLREEFYKLIDDWRTTGKVSPELERVFPVFRIE